ncbi:MAG TPA: hypothetical protein VG965_03020 [Patescibacteria group bacterium]|nr:hypothetical protein [Patescibacteria group bacterium]
MSNSTETPRVPDLSTYAAAVNERNNIKRIREAGRERARNAAGYMYDRVLHRFEGKEGQDVKPIVLRSGATVEMGVSLSVPDGIPDSAVAHLYVEGAPNVMELTRIDGYKISADDARREVVDMDDISFFSPALDSFLEQSSTQADQS